MAANLHLYIWLKMKKGDWHLLFFYSHAHIWPLFIGCRSPLTCRVFVISSNNAHVTQPTGAKRSLLNVQGEITICHFVISHHSKKKPDYSNKFRRFTAGGKRAVVLVQTLIVRLTFAYLECAGLLWNVAAKNFEPIYKCLYCRENEPY